MASTWPEVRALQGVADPGERAQKALAAMEDARGLMEAIADIRARAVHELYVRHGASKAARLLGISRVNLYRIIGQIPEVREQRRETAGQFAVALAAMAALNSATADGLLTAHIEKE
jgi:hypothetical protein